MRRKVEPFKFKKFSIEHSKSTLAVGTDAILLASWADLKDTSRVLDIGTGCGVMALAIAQRLDNDFSIEAIDTDKESIEEANKNFSNSNWKNSLSAHVSDFKEYQTTNIDLLICNPPFFRQSYKNPKLYKTLARHQENFDFSDLAKFASKSLATNGKIVMVYPFIDKEYLIDTFKKHGWNTSKIEIVYSKKSKPESRVLIEFKQQISTPTTSELTIYQEDNTYTESYKSLTKPYYLKF